MAAPWTQLGQTGLLIGLGPPSFYINEHSFLFFTGDWQALYKAEVLDVKVLTFNTKMLPSTHSEFVFIYPLTKLSAIQQVVKKLENY